MSINLRNYENITIKFNIHPMCEDIVNMIMEMNGEKKAEIYFSNHFNRHIEFDKEIYFKDPYSNIINVYWNLYLDVPSGYIVKTNDIQNVIFERIARSHFNGNGQMATNIVNINTTYENNHFMAILYNNVYSPVLMPAGIKPNK